MASQLLHRVFAVLFILVWLNFSGNMDYWSIASGVLVGALFGASWLSPDIDLRLLGKSFHRNFLFHSILIPLAAYAVFPHRITFLIILAWGSHVLLDLFTAKNLPRISPSSKSWGNSFNFIVAIISAITALLLATNTVQVGAFYALLESFLSFAKL